MKITSFGELHLGAQLALPLFSGRVAAGFPSPAEDHLDQALDLNEHLIRRPAATYYARAAGNSMEGLGIYDGDLLIVDRAVRPEQGAVVIAAIHGELTCKLLDIKHRCLRASHPDYPAISLPEDIDLVIEGVVIHAVHHLHHKVLC